MKFKYFPLILLGGLVTWALPMAHAEADDDAPATKVTKKAKKGKKAKKKAEAAQEEDSAEAPESAVAAKIKGNNYFTETKPNLKADYYIFLQSASWCGPCNAEMPEVVKAYEQMKASGRVELILLSHDDNPTAGKGFLTKYKATFPGTMCHGASVPQIPPPPGIPNAAIVKADGTLIKSDHGSIIRSWKELTIGKYAVIGDDGEPRVGKALKDMKFTNGKPSRKADFYIYLYAPSASQTDKDLLSSLACQYKDMKKDKVEVIFMSNEKTPAMLVKTLKACKAKFPAIQSSKVEELPGLGTLGNEAKAWIVTQSGAEVISGTPDIANEWQKVVEANK